MAERGRGKRPPTRLRSRTDGASAGKPQRPGGTDRKAGRKSAPSRREGGGQAEPAGLGTRRLAVELIERVLLKGQALDDALEQAGAALVEQLEARDRAFARLIAATVLRRLGSLEAVLGRFLERPLPSAARRAQSILLVAAAQILVLGTPAHAAINLAVEQCRRDARANRFDKLANAVLRKVATGGAAVLATLDSPRIDVTDWIWQRWVAAYGEATARAIAAASLVEAPLDLSVKGDAATWAERLGGRLLATGSIRLATHGRVDELAGFSEGAWWVQDAAAALPARLLGDVAGLEVADLCAAPGGKTAALASQGARVIAVDASVARLERLAANMARLDLAGAVQVVAADVTAWRPGRRFGAVLIDAPCTSTGTIRRHPDILHLKRPGDAARLAALQRRLIEAAAGLVEPGGTLVYCVCSLEPEEGVAIVEAFLAANADFRRSRLSPGEAGIEAGWITPDGDLQTLPCHQPDRETSTGMDGFYAARLVRLAG